MTLVPAALAGPMPNMAQSGMLDGMTEKAGEEKISSESEHDIFKVKSSGDDKLQARSKVYFLTNAITNCREHSLRIPGLDLSVLPREKRDEIERGLAAMKQRKLASLLNQRGTSHVILGDSRLAIKDLDEAVDSDAEYAPAYNNRAWVRAQLGKFELALDDINKALSLAPRMEEAYDTRGSIKLVQRKFTEALSDFNTSIDLNGKYAEAYYHRAITYKLMGDQKNSRSDSERAKKLEAESTGLD